MAKTRSRMHPKRPTFAQLTAQGPGIHPISPSLTPVQPTSAQTPPVSPTEAIPTVGNIPKVGGVTGPGGLTDTIGLTGGGGILHGLLPYLKMTAGGLMVGTSAILLVYIAGRNTPVGKVAGMAAGATPAGAAVKAASANRKALGAERTTQQRKASSEVARSRVETVSTRSGAPKVKTVSKREGAARRTQDAKDEDERREAGREQSRANLMALRERRSRSGSRSKVSA